MHSHVREHLESHLGVLSSRAASRLGVSNNELRSMVKNGQLARVTRGAYVDAAQLQDAGPEDAHRLRVQAVVLCSGGRFAASHQSAALLYNLPLLRKDLPPVRVVHTSKADCTRTYDSFTVHRCPGRDALTTHGGVATVVPSVAVLGTALASDFRSGVMVADAALHGKLTTKDELETALAGLRRVPGVSRARRVVEVACPLAESAGESLLRLVLIELGHRFIAQHPITAGRRTVARVDFYLPDLGVVLEFDGKVKYGGPDGKQVLGAEKNREDDIRGLRYGVARIVWDDVFAPHRVEMKVVAAARSMRGGDLPAKR